METQRQPFTLVQRLTTCKACLFCGSLLPESARGWFKATDKW